MKRTIYSFFKETVNNIPENTAANPDSITGQFIKNKKG